MRSKEEQDTIVKKALSIPITPVPSANHADPTEGRIRAVLICSHVLEAEIWLALDPGFDPADGLAVYYPDELPALASKSPEELRGIHKVKLTFPGCRVIQ